MKNMFFFALVAVFFAASCDNDAGLIGTSNDGAISGKYRTMLIVDNFMYAVNDQQLITLDITDNENPVELNKQEVGIDIENIYHSENTLFIGSRSHLHIFAVDSEGIPSKKSDTQYVTFNSSDVTPCDPVVAEQEIAYVTLSSTYWNDEDPCGTGLNINELRVYDVENLNSPALVKTKQMHSPKGLSIDGNYLFVSNTDHGFSVFEVDHQGGLERIDKITGFTSYDLIAKDNKLLVVSPDEIRQYDYSDIENITLYSTLSLR